MGTNFAFIKLIFGGDQLMLADQFSSKNTSSSKLGGGVRFRDIWGANGDPMMRLGGGRFSFL